MVNLSGQLDSQRRGVVSRYKYEHHCITEVIKAMNVEKTDSGR